MALNASSLLRRKKAILWTAAAIASCWFLFQLFGPDPAIEISPATTYITEPLAADGLPDYFEYLRREWRRGVTPENNAAAVVWTIAVPADQDADLRARQAAELGIPAPNANVRQFEPLSAGQFRDEAFQWLVDVGWTPPPEPKPEFPDDPPPPEPTPEQLEQAIEAHRGAWIDAASNDATTRPWRGEDFPPLADWLARNDWALDAAVEASQRSHFYFSMELTPEAEGPPLLGVDFAPVETMRTLARGLCARGMRHAGEGRLEAALADLAACRRLARLLGQSPFQVVKLVACGMEHFALEALRTLATMSGAESTFYAQVKSEAADRKPVCDMIRGFTHDDRIMVLDALTYQIRNFRGKGDEDGQNVGTVLNRSIPVRIDWNMFFRGYNESFDLIRAYFNETDPARREALSDRYFEIELQMVEVADDWLMIPRGFFSTGVRSKQIFARSYILTMPSGTNAGLSAMGRNVSYAQLASVAAAIAEWHQRESAYPERLAALVPEFLAAPPVDSQGAPLRYELRGDGFLLYSLGPDGKDQGGDDFSGEIVDGEWIADLRDEKELYGDYDFVIRAPRPPLEWPRR